MTTLHITPCEPADCDAIDRLTARAYAPGGFAADDPYFIEILNVAQRAQQALVLVARQNGVPVGTLTCALPSSSWQEIARADEAELRILAVVPEQQRQGIGSALVRASIEHARHAGCNRPRPLQRRLDARRTPPLRTPRLPSHPGTRLATARRCPPHHLPPGSSAIICTWGGACPALFCDHEIMVRPGAPYVT